MFSECGRGAGRGGRGGDAGEGPRASGSFARARARLCEVPASSRARARFRATPHVAAPAARARRPRGPAGRPRAEPTVRAHEGARRKWAADGRLAAAAAGRRSPADLAGALAPASRGEFPPGRDPGRDPDPQVNGLCRESAPARPALLESEVGRESAFFQVTDFLAT